MRYRLIFSFAIALLSALTLVFGACDEKGELSLEEYIQRLGEIFEDADARSQALEDQFGVAFSPTSPEEARMKAAQEAFAQQTAVFDDAVSEVEGLDPPSQAQGTHDELVSAASAITEFFDEFRERVESVKSAAELRALFAELDSPDEEIIAAFKRIDNACFALKGIADGNNINGNLACEEEKRQ